jgi:hypothetical protein
MLDKFTINTDTDSGFSMKFNNGYVISVQFSEHNYCNKGETAEIAIIKPNGDFYTITDSDDVKGYCSPDEVLSFMVKAANLD